MTFIEYYIINNNKNPFFYLKFLELSKNGYKVPNSPTDPICNSDVFSLSQKSGLFFQC